MYNVAADIKLLLENPLLIYGAGKGAFRLIINLKELNADIIGLAVSDISDSRTLGFDGFEVQTPDAFEEFKNSAVVLIATSPKYQDEIKENCMRLGFKKTVLYTNDLIKELSLMSHKRLFIRNNLPFDTEVISIGGGKYLNPFSKLFPEKFGIMDQWEDICSTALGDMSMSHEGAYEYGPVKISDGDVVLDIGASIGYVSVYAVSKGAESYAFEPSPENHSLIKYHSRLNGNRIHLKPYAVSNECGSVEFGISSLCSTGSSLDGCAKEARTPITVSQITVDEFVKNEDLKKVDYIHANIVGAERLMLQGAQDTLRNFAPKIVICSYCEHDDRIILPELILKANPNYKILHNRGKIYAYV